MKFLTFLHQLVFQLWIPQMNSLLIYVRTRQSNQHLCCLFEEKTTLHLRFNEMYWTPIMIEIMQKNIVCSRWYETHISDSLKITCTINTNTTEELYRMLYQNVIFSNELVLWAEDQRIKTIKKWYHQIRTKLLIYHGIPLSSHTWFVQAEKLNGHVNFRPNMKLFNI